MSTEGKDAEGDRGLTEIVDKVKEKLKVGGDVRALSFRIYVLWCNVL